MLRESMSSMCAMGYSRQFAASHGRVFSPAWTLIQWLHNVKLCQ